MEFLWRGLKKKKMLLGCLAPSISNHEFVSSNHQGSEKGGVCMEGFEKKKKKPT